MSNYSELLSFVLGLFLPPVVEFVKTKFSDNKIIHYLIALGSCFVIGIISTLIEGKFNTTDLDTIVGSISLALVSSQSVYNLYWKPKEIGQKFISYLATKKLV